MKVTLLSHTPDALNLLLGTKNTRMGNNADSPEHWSDEKKLDHLKYMLGTIKSSWEFIDFVFLIEGVTRAFTQQLERTRSGSFAEQSLRAVDASGFEVKMPSLRNWSHLAEWDAAVEVSMRTYSDLVADGVSLQDARGILPINIETQITCKFNLRTLSDMARVRLCTRTQGEYQDVFRAMRQACIDVYPWVEDFIQVNCVADGVCAFPNYGPQNCFVWHPMMDQTFVKRIAKERFWTSRQEANPVAAGGKAA